MTEGDLRTLVTLPAGSLLQVIRCESDKFIEVLWEGREVMMFRSDLRERGHKDPEQ